MYRKGIVIVVIFLAIVGFSLAAALDYSESLKAPCGLTCGYQVYLKNNETVHVEAHADQGKLCVWMGWRVRFCLFNPSARTCRIVSLDTGSRNCISKDIPIDPGETHFTIRVEAHDMVFGETHSLLISRKRRPLAE